MGPSDGVLKTVKVRRTSTYPLGTGLILDLIRESRWDVPLVFHSYHAGNNAPEKLSSRDRNGATPREADR